MSTPRGRAFFTVQRKLVFDLAKKRKKQSVVKCWERAMWSFPPVVSGWTLDSGLKEQTCQTRKYGAEKLNTTCYCTTRREGVGTGGVGGNKGQWLQLENMTIIKKYPWNKYMFHLIPVLPFWARGHTYFALSLNRIIIKETWIQN